ncbi:MAG: hypothetical protein IKY83_13470 [Proteobacteria bacterium]|nr:hypothetical protein [Pseudomonadota bacterium]
MTDSLHYTGIFLSLEDRARFWRLCNDIRNSQKKSPLAKRIAHPHVTEMHEKDEAFADFVEKRKSIFGEHRVKIKIIGYANDGENEAVQIEFVGDEADTESKQIINHIKGKADNNPEILHITLSISETGEAKNSRYLRFEKIDQEALCKQAQLPIDAKGAFEFNMIYDCFYNPDPECMDFDYNRRLTGESFVYIPYYVRDDQAFKTLIEDTSSWECVDISQFCKYFYTYISYYPCGARKVDCYKSQTDDRYLLFYFETTKIAILSIRSHIGDKTVARFAEMIRSLRKFNDIQIAEIEQNLFRKKLNDIAKAFFYAGHANIGGKDQKADADTVRSDLRGNYLLRLDVSMNDPMTFTERDRVFQHKLLYHFRGDGYLNKLYEPDQARESREVWSNDPLKVWGISASAAVCLTCSERGNTKHLRRLFVSNFANYYHFLYVCLLHQKYFLYYLCSQVTSRGNNDAELLKALRAYSRKLIGFSNDYLYKCISDVDQYQGLYEYVQNAFNIWPMLEDTREPLENLKALEEDQDRQKREEMEQLERELKEAREQKEKEEKEAQDFLRMILSLISVLTLVTVLSNLFALDEPLHAVLANIFQGDLTYKQTCFLIIISIAILLLIMIVHILFGRKIAKWIGDRRAK